MNTISKKVLWGLALPVAIAIAAGTFIANEQEFGYVAPAAISAGGFESGTAVAYTPWFENTSYRGDIIAYPLTDDGIPLVLSPSWRASAELNARDFDTRYIVTTDGAEIVTASMFEWGALTEPQETTLVSVEMLNYIRGDRTNEGTGTIPRVRKGVLGDIIHSNPVYVRAPRGGYPDADYLAFAATHKNREPRVYVGANDGMLHSFDAATGEEVFAYIPSTLISKLSDLAVEPYSHSYYVDGPLTAEEAEYDDAWHTVLVGGLGAGGRGYFALDLTSATVESDSEALEKVLWEFHSGSAGADNLGYGYSRASIVNLNNDQWGAVVANGYESLTGKASLYILDISDGSVIKEIVVTDPDGTSNNGLSSPTLIDIDDDFVVDFAYAGDRNGNLWKFDLRSDEPDEWVVSNSEPLFQTAAVGGVRQPITIAPQVGLHPYQGYMVYVATGELFDASDATDFSLQSAYGIWDNNWEDAVTPIAVGSLVSQTTISKSHASGASVRVVTNNQVDWDTQFGWATPLIVADATSLDRGERVLQNLTLRDDRIQFITVNPTLASGDNWFLQLNAFTGGAPIETIVDVDDDKILTLADNVDGDDNDLIEDEPLDRVVGYYLGFGLSSLPIIGSTGDNRAAALFNHIEAISPSDLDFPDDPGVKGGHFDLDTSSNIFAFNEGDTDGHVHEWDDDHDSATIDFFDMLEAGKLFEINADSNAVTDEDAYFFLTLSNTDLNSAGVMEINGASFGVVPYQNLQTRWIKGTMTEYENFPIYKLGALTDAEKDAGIVRLETLRISFDSFAILKGELIGTNTGCVRGNEPGALGEYRNGALTLQALDATGFDGFEYDPVDDIYLAANTAVDGTHQYARSLFETPGGKEYTDSMLWESTVFWHWDGDCYGTESWQEQYNACWVTNTETCWVADSEAEDKADKKKDKDKDKDDPEPEPDPDDPDADPDPDDDSDDLPDNILESVTTADGGQLGRLFWRELVPDE